MFDIEDQAYTEFAHEDAYVTTLIDVYVCNWEILDQWSHTLTHMWVWCLNLSSWFGSSVEYNDTIYIYIGQTMILYILLFSLVKKPCYDILIEGFSKVSNYFQNEILEDDKK